MNSAELSSRRSRRMSVGESYPPPIDVGVEEAGEVTTDVTSFDDWTRGNRVNLVRCCRWLLKCDLVGPVDTAECL